VGFWGFYLLFLPKNNIMIGVFDAVHPSEGYVITVRFSRFDGIIKILSITRYDKDILGRFSSNEIEHIKSQIRIFYS
jgi:hypothetical protein